MVAYIIKHLKGCTFLGVVLESRNGQSLPGATAVKMLLNYLTIILEQRLFK